MRSPRSSSVVTVFALVVSLLITGVASVSDIKSIGRLGGRTLVTFVLLLIGAAVITIPVALALFAVLPAHREVLDLKALKDGGNPVAGLVIGGG